RAVGLSREIGARCSVGIVADELRCAVAHFQESPVDDPKFHMESTIQIGVGVGARDLTIRQRFNAPPMRLGIDALSDGPSFTIEEKESAPVVRFNEVA